jgi:acetyl-CoA synthetase
MPQELYDVPADWAGKAIVDKAIYEDLYERSLADPDSFWRDVAGDRISWFQPFTKVQNSSFAKDAVSIRWFEDGVLNACHNCVDRHLPMNGDKPAIIWEGDEAAETETLTYRQLHDEVCRMANVLKSLGVAKGDRVTIYLPMIPMAVVSMLACARIGAVHSVVFAGFSPDSLAKRIESCGSSVVITADQGVRGGRKIPLKDNVDEAARLAPNVENVLVVRRTGAPVSMQPGRDAYYDQLASAQSSECPCEPMAAEDPLFVLYTSGSTGEPKGILHTTGGYMVFASLTHEYVFDYRKGDVYWCTADVGWITGHSYIVYGPLANGATTLIHEGVPNYPSTSRWWDMIDRHRVNIFYTAPTAIRALMQNGDSVVGDSSRATLRLLGTVGEPINPDAWEWYHRVVGNSRCPVVDTWWQTETGGFLISPLPGATNLKPGSASWPMVGVKPEVVDDEGNVLEGEASGNLCIAASWPGQARTIYGDHKRFEETYFSTFENKYFTGDGCRRDADGYYWITGRVDDVINVSGHRLGTAELESALGSHSAVSEAAVVPYAHPLKGQGIYAYVNLVQGASATAQLQQDLKQWIRSRIGALAAPDFIQFADGLPKTRSGKILRRILRKVADDDINDLGDTSTLSDPNVIKPLVMGRLNIKVSGV